MRILVFGAGALGGFLAGALAQKHEVVLYGRGETIQTVRKSGITLTGITKLKNAPETASSPVELRDHDFALIILAVKAYDTDAALDVINMIPGLAPVLSLQNGLDNEKKISNVLGSERTLGGVTSHGLTFLKPGHIHHAGLGETIIGEMDGNTSGRIDACAHALKSVGIETSVSTDIRREIWAKGVVNAGINPITALTGLKNGYLLTVPLLSELLEKSCIECVNVARAEGIDFREPEMIEKTRNVARLTSDNRSSMLQDLERGRRTEIDSINRRIVEIGDRHGIHTPVNSTLVALVKGIEEGRNSR